MSDATPQQSAKQTAIGPVKVAREYLRDHPFKSVLGTWGTVLAGTGIYLYRRNIPTQLKIIQARIIAQASLLFGAMTFAAVSILAEDEEKSPAASAWMLKDFKEKEHEKHESSGGYKHSKPAARTAQAAEFAEKQSHASSKLHAESGEVAKLQ